MEYRVIYPCGDAMCHEDFENFDRAQIASRKRIMELTRWAENGVADKDAWRRVQVRRLTETEKAKYK